MIFGWVYNVAKLLLLIDSVHFICGLCFKFWIGISFLLSLYIYYVDLLSRAVLLFGQYSAIFENINQIVS